MPLMTFLTTLIRRRVWFYWFSALGLVAAILTATVFRSPDARAPLPKVFSAQLYMKAAAVPEALSPYFGQSFGDDMAFYLMNLGLVADVYRQTLAAPAQLAMPAAQFNGVIKDFISDSMTVKKTEVSAFVVLTLAGLSEDREKLFLKAMAEEVRSRMRASVLNIADTLRSAGGSDTPAARLLNTLLSSPQFPCAAAGEVVVVESPVGGIKIGTLAMAVLILIGFVGLGLVAALLREGIASLGARPEVARAFRDAWTKADGTPKRND